MKKEYDEIDKEVLKRKNEKISSYRGLKSLYRQMKRQKPKSTKHYKKDKEIAQWYALAIGLLALSININEEKETEEYQLDSTVYFSLLTNISNDIFSIIKLVDNGLEFQANIIMRNLIELLYTLLVVLINKEKRKEYYNSGRLQNSYEVWNKNFKMSKLNEELFTYETKVFEEGLAGENSEILDEEFRKNLKNMRRNIYKHYSSYIHNDYISCVLSCYSPKIHKSSKEPELNYNLWGAYNYMGQSILDSLNRNMMMTMLYFKKIISKDECFRNYKYISEKNHFLWNDGIIILFMLEEKIKKGIRRKMKKIVVATNNKGKLKEINEILKEYDLISLKDIDCDIEVEENQDTFEGNSLKKAKEISKITDMPCIADDSGLCIDILDGWPGVYTARFLGENTTQEQRNEAILEKMKEFKGEKRKARVKCIMTYYYEGKCFIGKGEIVGKIAEERRGNNGFGFDEIFELENGKTLAELSQEEKNVISARKEAIENLKKQMIF